MGCPAIGAPRRRGLRRLGLSREEPGGWQVLNSRVAYPLRLGFAKGGLFFSFILHFASSISNHRNDLEIFENPMITGKFLPL